MLYLCWDRISHEFVLSMCYMFLWALIGMHSVIHTLEQKSPQNTPGDPVFLLGLRIAEKTCCGYKQESKTPQFAVKAPAAFETKDGVSQYVRLVLCEHFPLSLSPMYTSSDAPSQLRKRIFATSHPKCEVVTFRCLQHDKMSMLKMLNVLVVAKQSLLPTG